MEETLEKILTILQAQEAKIKALEAQLEAYGCGVDTLIDTIYEDKDSEWYNAFSDRHKAKFEPYIEIMDKFEGGDSLRTIYNKTKDLSDIEGYDEEAYVGEVLSNVIEMIESLKAIVPPEAHEALEVAEEAVVAAAAEAQEPEEEIQVQAVGHILN